MDHSRQPRALFIFFRTGGKEAVNSLAIVMYHYVRPILDSAYPGIKGLEVHGFRRQLDHLEANYVIVSADDLLAAVKRERPLPERACLLTFDDGYRDHVDYVLPELLKRKLKGCFFPVVKPVVDQEMLDVNRVHFILASEPDVAALVDELHALCIEHGILQQTYDADWHRLAHASRYDPREIVFIKRMLQHALPEKLRNMIAAELFRRHVSKDEKQFAAELYISKDDAKLLVASGMHVGNHTYSHRWLDREPEQNQEREIDEALAFLATIGATTSDWMMCYPYGGYNETTLSVLARKNCPLGLTTKIRQANLAVDDPLELPRFDTNDFPQ
jgi:peptidoglycan/xylan/chitin deacetylase (PgdA/CDA1 family)